VDGACSVLPRRSRGQTRATRGVNNPPQRATGVSRALACVLNTRGCPQVFCTGAPVPRSSILCRCRCINFPGKQVNAVWGRYSTACEICVKQTWSALGARQQNLSRLRVEKLGRVCRQSPDHPSCLASPGWVLTPFADGVVYIQLGCPLRSVESSTQLHLILRPDLESPRQARSIELLGTPESAVEMHLLHSLSCTSYNGEYLPKPVDPL
jgi:hypothetical protein